MSDDMNEIAKINDGVMVVADPFSPDRFHSSADSVIKSMFAKKDEIVAAYESLGNVDEAPLQAVKECRKCVEETDGMAKDYEKKLLDALLDLSGFKSVMVQLKGTKTRIDPHSVRGRFAEIIKVLKEREDAEKPHMPKHTYFYSVTATDAEHAAVQKAIAKVDAGYGVVSPQKDSEWKTAAKLFGVKV